MLTVVELIRDGFAHHSIFSIGFLLVIGFILGKLCEKIKLPAITGYIIAGLITGDSLLGFIHPQSSPLLHTISEITLSFIALIIGGEFSFTKLKIYGKNVIFLTLFQMFSTFILVYIVLILLNLPSYAAMILGAIASATAPAATVVIVEKLKARGEFVDYLYGIVALDDAGAVILFSVVFALSSSMIAGSSVEITHSLLHAFKEISFSIIIGIASGFIVHYATIKKKLQSEIKLIALGIVFLATSIAISLNVSPLITNMTIGMILINLNKKNLRIFHMLEPITPPFYALFFAIAGTELNLAIFKDLNILTLGIAFIIARAIGKYSGIYIPSKIIKAPKDVKNYLGLSLLPQAGVAIGLIIFVQASPVIVNASQIVKDQIVMLVNIVLISVFINEIIGPPLSKFAIVKSLENKK